jgi:hypothetical protein
LREKYKKYEEKSGKEGKYDTKRGNMKGKRKEKG